MKLTWHIAKKDLRRIATPLAIWLPTFTVVGLWMRFAPVVEDLWPWDDLSWGLSVTGGITGAIGWMQIAAGGLLAGLIVQEDAAGSAPHWRTKPIGTRRLLGGKLCAVLLGLVAGPVLALAPVWWASGFSAFEVLAAAGECAASQLLVVWIAVVVASLTEDLGQFIFAAIGVSVVAGFSIAEQSMLIGPTPESWTLVALVLGALGGVVVLVVVWPHGQLRRGWIVLGGVMTLLIAGRVGFAGSQGHRGSVAAAPTVEFQESPELRARLGEAGLAALQERARAIRSDRVGRVIVRPRIIGECAAREGASFSAGAATLQVLAAIENGLRRRAATWFALRLEERDVWPSWREGSFRNEVRSLQGNDDYIAQIIATKHDVAVGRSFEDVLLVVLPKRGAAAVLKESARLAVVRYSLLRAVAAPECELPLRDAEGREVTSVLNEPDARLVKVRLEKTYSAAP